MPPQPIPTQEEANEIRLHVCYGVDPDDGDGGGSYVGPLDIVPGAVVAYSQRALASSSTGNVITVCRDSDNVEQDFALTDSNSIDVTAVQSFIGAANPFVVSFFDQSGHGCSISSASNRAQTWQASGLGGKPTIARSSSALEGNSGFSHAGGAATIFFACRGNVWSSPTILTWNTAALLEVVNIGFHWNASGDVYCAVNDSNIAWTSVTHAANAVADYIFEIIIQPGGVVQIFVNGVDFNASTGGDPAEVVGSAIGGVVTLAGIASFYIGELIIWPSAISDVNRGLVRENVAAYYGIELP